MLSWLTCALQSLHVGGEDQMLVALKRFVASTRSYGVVEDMMSPTPMKLRNPMDHPRQLKALCV